MTGSDNVKLVQWTIILPPQKSDGKTKLPGKLIAQSDGLVETQAVGKPLGVELFCDIVTGDIEVDDDVLKHFKDNRRDLARACRYQAQNWGETCIDVSPF